MACEECRQLKRERDEAITHAERLLDALRRLWAGAPSGHWRERYVAECAALAADEEKS